VAEREPRLGVLALLVAAAASGPACGDPCDQDPFHCGSGDEFALAPSCELTGSLAVVFGEGTADLEPFIDGMEPLVHTGPQGGHHLCLGLRVDDPALDYPQLKLVFDAELNDPERCADSDDPACDPWINSAHRELVLGPDLPLDDALDVEQTGIILILSIWPDDLERRVSLDVVDPCGREGLVEHVVPPVL